MIADFPPYLKKVAEEKSNEDGSMSISDELEQQKHFKPKGSPPYSAASIRYAISISLYVCSHVPDTPQTISSSFIFIVEQDLQRWS